MKILVVSDTHGKLEYFREAVELEKPFEALIHCGDIEGDEDKIQRISGSACFMVSGNNDFFTGLPGEMEFRIADQPAFLTHGHHYYVYMNTEHLRREAILRNARYAFFGHTHKPVVKNEGGVYLINPGSLSYPRQEGRLPSYLVMHAEYNKEPIFEIKYLQRGRKE